MTGLLSQIKSYFVAQLSSTFTGGLHSGVAPAGTAAPYCTYDVIAAPATSKYGGVAFAESQIQFVSWGAPSATALANLETLIGAFDEHLFTISGKQNFFMLRMNDPISMPDSPGYDEQGRELAGWMVTYQYGTT